MAFLIIFRFRLGLKMHSENLVYYYQRVFALVLHKKVYPFG